MEGDTTSAARIVVIEDDAPTRAAFCAAITRDPQLALAGAAGDHDEALPLIVAGEYDVLLVDINLGTRKSFDLIELSRANHEARIMVISVLGDEDSVISAIEAGADGYILKDGAFADLGQPIAQVLAGEAPISPGVARHLLRRFQPSTMAGSDAESVALSRRERQVLTEFARGASYKEVARKFDISLHTVGDYVKTLYRKLQVNSRGAAVNKALKAGMIEL
ncbi:Two component transcriptional regulator, LuxR family [Erythrobacter sp. EC-HK427]|nr:Two component transcriptional regulator, LuxR family [Erythrobacter sp. EC-HK427]